MNPVLYAQPAFIFLYFELSQKPRELKRIIPQLYLGEINGVRTKRVMGVRLDNWVFTAMNKSGTLEQPFQFSSKRYDADTGLNYYGYRFYAPAVERWMNRE